MVPIFFFDGRTEDSNLCINQLILNYALCTYDGTGEGTTTGDQVITGYNTLLQRYCMQAPDLFDLERTNVFCKVTGELMGYIKASNFISIKKTNDSEQQTGRDAIGENRPTGNRSTRERQGEGSGTNPSQLGLWTQD